MVHFQIQVSCTAVHFSTLHLLALHSLHCTLKTALHCPSTALHCTALSQHYTAPSQHGTTRHCTLHSEYSTLYTAYCTRHTAHGTVTALYCTALQSQSTALYHQSTALHYSTLQYTTVHCTALTLHWHWPNRWRPWGGYSHCRVSTSVSR
jgi:hypothetical protein